MKELGLNTPAAPVVPKEGCRLLGISAKNLPAGSAYDLVRSLNPIANAVYPIPTIPSKENGARADRFFSRHNGNKTIDVKPSRVLDRVKLNPAVEKIALKVSAKIMEYASVAQKVLNVQLAAAITLVSFEIVFSHASLYEVEPVYAQTLPIRENPYPESAPMTVMRNVAGIMAEGALPKAEIPAGRLNTPAPTILLTRLKVRPDMDALPPLDEDSSPATAAVMNFSFLTRPFPTTRGWDESTLLASVFNKFTPIAFLLMGVMKPSDFIMFPTIDRAIKSLIFVMFVSRFTQFVLVVFIAGLNT